MMQTRDSKPFDTKERIDGYDYLAPDGSEIQLLVGVNGGGLAHCRLPAGRVSMAVRHRTVEEIWFFVSGSGDVWRELDGVVEITRVGAGTSLNIPVGTSFQFRNNGPKALDFVIATIPRWPGSDEAIPVDGQWETQ